MIFRSNYNETGLTLEVTIEAMDGETTLGNAPVALTESTIRGGEYSATITDGDFFFLVERIVGANRIRYRSGYVSTGLNGFACIFSNRYQMEAAKDLPFMSGVENSESEK